MRSPPFVRSFAKSEAGVCLVVLVSLVGLSARREDLEHPFKGAKFLALRAYLVFVGGRGARRAGPRRDVEPVVGPECAGAVTGEGLASGQWGPHRASR